MHQLLAAHNYHHNHRLNHRQNHHHNYHHQNHHNQHHNHHYNYHPENRGKNAPTVSGRGSWGPWSRRLQERHCHHHHDNHDGYDDDHHHHHHLHHEHHLNQLLITGRAVSSLSLNNIRNPSLSGLYQIKSGFYHIRSLPVGVLSDHMHFYHDLIFIKNEICVIIRDITITSDRPSTKNMFQFSQNNVFKAAKFFKLPTT